MSARDQFGTGHWADLVEAAPKIARAVSATVGSRREAEHEMQAFLDFVSRSEEDDGLAPLVRELAAAVRQRIEAGTDEHPERETLVTGIESARVAGAILAVQAAPDDAAAVCRWLLDAGTTVAAAAREGDFAGLGGRQVSVHEQEALAAIRDALTGDATP